MIESNEELLFDRQESFNDIVLCLVAKSKGIEEYEKRLSELSEKEFQKFKAEFAIWSCQSAG